MHEGETLSCIPKTKICDGYADIVFPDMENDYRLKFCSASMYNYDLAKFFLDEAYCTDPNAIILVEGLVMITFVLTIIMAALTLRSVVATLSSACRSAMSLFESGGEFTTAGRQTFV